MGHSGSDRPVTLLSVGFASLKHSRTSLAGTGAGDLWLDFFLHIHAGFDLYRSGADHPAHRGLKHSPDYRLTVDVPDAHGTRGLHQLDQGWTKVMAVKDRTLGNRGEVRRRGHDVGTKSSVPWAKIRCPLRPERQCLSHFRRRPRQQLSHNMGLTKAPIVSKLGVFLLCGEFIYWRTLNG